jgi:putative cell wall-binding protein
VPPTQPTEPAPTEPKPTEPPHSHSWKDATCTEPKTCTTCGAKEGNPAGHKEQNVPGKAATCTEKGLTDGKKCSVCGTTITAQTETPAKGHSFVDGKCACGAKDPNYVKPVVGVNRVAGSNRWNTAFGVADMVKATQNIDKFPAVIVANGNEFADALAGTYLATQKNIPILVTHVNNDKIMGQVKDYIKANVQPGGTVYVLGGDKAVDPKIATGLEAYTVTRLAGSNRYKTNIEVLKATNLTGGNRILVATGRNFADSLSASATGLPILMVHGNVKLQPYQIEYLNTLGTNNEFIIIGGTSAVSQEVAESLLAYGSVGRIEGKNRYETSIKIAETFFGTPRSAVIATGTGFADGLCGGILAYNMKAPLILTVKGRETVASGYLAQRGIQDGYILGGENALSPDTVVKVFG